MAANPVSQRHNMTSEQFDSLPEATQAKIVNYKMMDQMVKPHLQRAISQTRKTAEKLRGKEET